MKHPRFALVLVLSFALNAGTARASIDTVPVFDVSVLECGEQITHRLSEIRIGSAPIAMRSGAPIRSARGGRIHEQLSAPFSASQGDTLELYRAGIWGDDGPQFAEARGGDTVDFTIELVDAVSKRRLAVVDSMGMLVEAGVRTIYGERGAYAVVRYVIPASMRSARMILRRRSAVRGSGRCVVTAREYRDEAPSKMLRDPKTLPQRRRFGQGLDRRATDMLIAACSGRLALKVRPHPGGRIVAIAYPTAPASGATTLVRYDEDGEQQSIAVVEGAAGRPGTLIVPHDGRRVQYVGLFHDNLLVAATKLEASAPQVKSAALPEEE